MKNGFEADSDRDDDHGQRQMPVPIQLVAATERVATANVAFQELKKDSSIKFQIETNLENHQYLIFTTTNRRKEARKWTKWRKSLSQASNWHDSNTSIYYRMQKHPRSAWGWVSWTCAASQVSSIL